MFFHEVMEAVEGGDDNPTAIAGTTKAAGGSLKNYFTTSFGSPACEEAVLNLSESLKQIKQKILGTGSVVRGGKIGSSFLLILPNIGHVRVMIAMVNSNAFSLLRPMNPFGL